MVILCDSNMIKETMMCDILKRAYSEPPINSRTCYNHVHPLVYPIEYDACPACAYKKITRVKLGIN